MSDHPRGSGGEGRKRSITDKLLAGTGVSWALAGATDDHPKRAAILVKMRDLLNAEFERASRLREERDAQAREWADSEATALEYLTRAERAEAERDELAAQLAKAREVGSLLNEALDEYVDHQSWRCGHAPHYYLAGDPPPDGCPCGLDEFTVRVQAALASLNRTEGGE